MWDNNDDYSSVYMESKMDTMAKDNNPHYGCNWDIVAFDIVNSDRRSCSDDGLLSINPLFQIFSQSIDAINVISVTRP